MTNSWILISWFPAYPSNPVLQLPMVVLLGLSIARELLLAFIGGFAGPVTG